MEKYLTNYSEPGELVRLKKTVDFIREVLRTYQTGAFQHVGFSCALAISKAEEYKNQVSPFCPAHAGFEKLAEMLRELYEGKEVYDQAVSCLDGICIYFSLDRHHLIRRDQAKA